MTPIETPGIRLVEVPDTGSPAFSPVEQVVLDAINRRVAGAESLEALIEFLFDSLRPVLPCDRIGVSFLEEGGVRLVAYHARTNYEPVCLGKGYAADLAGSSLEGVLRSGTPRIIDDLERYLAAHPASDSTQLLVREGVRSSMTCPLVVEGRIVGVLFLSSRRPAAFRDHDVRLHLAIAERLSQAAEKAHRIEQLAQANRAYMEMLAFVAHELLNPLAAIVMDAGLLRDGYVGDITPPQKQVVRRMTGRADYLLGLVRDYLELARIEGGDLRLRPRERVDLVAEVVEPACDLVAAQITERQVTVERVLPETPALATCDPGLLTVVVANLVGNAAKYGRAGGHVRLTVEADPNRFGVSVWNDGPGFPAGQRPMLFRKFSRLESAELSGRTGTGVGLYTSWRIVRLHGGQIAAESREGEWAEFRFSIPQPLPTAGSTGAALAGRPFPPPDV